MKLWAYGIYNMYVEEVYVKVITDDDFLLKCTCTESDHMQLLA